jgi:quinoprotein glucose dehydrogenase
MRRLSLASLLAVAGFAMLGAACTSETETLAASESAAANSAPAASFAASAASTATASGDWPAYGGDKAGTKYSPLDQINRDTIDELRIAWRRSSAPEALREAVPNGRGGARNYQHPPLMSDGL